MDHNGKETAFGMNLKQSAQESGWAEDCRCRTFISIICSIASGFQGSKESFQDLQILSVMDIKISCEVLRHVDGLLGAGVQ